MTVFSEKYFLSQWPINGLFIVFDTAAYTSRTFEYPCIYYGNRDPCQR